MWTINRWRVNSGEEEAFAIAWARVTKTIRAKAKGAQGSMLLRSRRDSAEFVIASHWDSFQDWQGFMQSDPSIGILSKSAQMLSAEALDEVDDLLADEP